MSSVKCHNCRRRRLRCDRSVPVCNKCAATGQECLGYGQLYRWTDSMASRGRMMGKKTFNTKTLGADNGHKSLLLSTKGDAFNSLDLGVGISLVDPLFQDLDRQSRYYLNYFTTRFCQELVVHDSMLHGANPFRELIPLSGEYTFLRHIVTAISAMHIHNQTRYTSLTKDRRSQSSSNSLIDALSARHKAIKALQGRLERQKSMGHEERLFGTEKNALFATVMFFINFTLIDTGKDGWRAHMRAAGKLVEAYLSLSADSPSSESPDCVNQMTLIDSGADGSHSLNVDTEQISKPPKPQHLSSLPPVRQSSLFDCVTADFMAYYVWSGTIDTLTYSAQGTRYNIPSIDIDLDNILPLLVRTEANSYHSCPAHLLLMILRTSILAREILSNGTDHPNRPTIEQLDSCEQLLMEMQFLDTQAWAVEICNRNVRILGYVDEDEVRIRTHIALAYQATAFLYMFLAVPELQEHIRNKHLNSKGEMQGKLPLLSAEEYASTALQLLSLIPPASPLYKYPTWPVFMTGVGAVLPERRAWVMARMQSMLGLCQWGMLRSAMETLTEIWKLRDAEMAMGQPDSDMVIGETTDLEQLRNDNWLVQLRSLSIDALIV